MEKTRKGEMSAADPAMQDLMALLNEWEAPEPSVWFDSRMMARFRAEQERTPEGFFARLRDRFLFSSQMRWKPVLAGAMAAVLVAGGGSYMGINGLHAPHPGASSATVQDLQILDNNAQAIQQMDQLLDNNDDSQEQS